MCYIVLSNLHFCRMYMGFLSSVISWTTVAYWVYWAIRSKVFIVQTPASSEKPQPGVMPFLVYWMASIDSSLDVGNSGLLVEMEINQTSYWYSASHMSYAQTCTFSGDGKLMHTAWGCGWSHFTSEKSKNVWRWSELKSPYALYKHVQNENDLMLTYVKWAKWPVVKRNSSFFPPPPLLPFEQV